MRPAAAPPGSRPLAWRDWAGFMAMVFGMFMAILDIQIVSASIDDIQAGLSVTAEVDTRGAGAVRRGLLASMAALIGI